MQFQCKSTVRCSTKRIFPCFRSCDATDKKRLNLNDKMMKTASETLLKLSASTANKCAKSDVFHPQKSDDELVLPKRGSVKMSLPCKVCIYCQRDFLCLRFNSIFYGDGIVRWNYG